MFLITIKLDRVSFKTKGRQNLQKTANFVIESIVLPSWIFLVDPTSAMYASAIYVSYIYGVYTIYHCTSHDFNQKTHLYTGILAGEINALLASIFLRMTMEKTTMKVLHHNSSRLFCSNYRPTFPDLNHILVKYE